MAYKVLGTPVIDDSRNILNIQNLNVAGVSTLGTLKVESGIVTATTGVVTYYGDGRYLNLEGIQINAAVSAAITATNVIGGRADVTQLNVSGLSTVGTLSAGNITATSLNSTGIVTATEFHTGASGSAIRVNSNTISGPSVLYLDPSAVGDNTGAVRIKGDLIVDGTQTIVNSTQVDVADKVIGIGSTSSPTDITADGGGLLLYGTTDKTFTWSDTTDAWTSSENLSLATGKDYEIDGTSVLSATTLGSGVVNSSLTSVGTLDKLDVGNVNSTGIVTALTIDATNINVTGVTTLAVVNSGNIYSTGIITATTFSGNFSGTVTGTASTATRATLIDTTATATDASYYLSFVENSSSTESETLRVDEGIRFNPSTNRLGINTTSLTETLNVEGNARITGSVSANSLSIAGSQIVSSTKELQNIATIDATTKATLEAALQISPNNFDDITVSGISTFVKEVGISTTTQSTDKDTGALVVEGGVGIEKNLNVGGWLSVAGIATFSQQVTVNSDVSVTGIVTAGDFNSTSDRRLKDNITVIAEPLAKVAQINGVTFTWKENGESSGGVIAQDVEVVLPELVSDGETKTVNYNGLIGLLIESVKELSAEVAELKVKLG